MKKLGIAILGALVAGALFFVFTTQDNNSVKEGALGTTPTTTFSLFRERGEVYYALPGASELMLSDATPSIDIVSGTKVRTVEGSAYVLFPDNSMMSIDANTTVVVEYTKNKVSIIQTLGNTYHRVKTLESGQEYEVRTPGTLAAVRGTSFAVLFDKNTKNSKVKVTKGTVDVKKLDSTKPLEEAPIVLEEVSVVYGSQVNVPDVATQITKPLVVIKMVDRDIKDGDWMEKNQLIDRATGNANVRRAFIEKLIKEQKNDAVPPREYIEKLRMHVEEFEKENGILDQTRDDSNTSDDVPVRVATLQVQSERAISVKPAITTDNISTREQTPLQDENLPPLDTSMSDTDDPFVLEFDRRYNYWFPVYEEKKVLCDRVSSMTPEILKARLLAFETTYKGVVPNKETILEFLRSVKTYCASSAADNRVLDEGYTRSYPF